MSFLPEYSKFAELFAAEKLEITSEQYSQLETYARLLVEWNEKINLTAILDPEGIAVKHFLDCLMIFKYVDIPFGASVIDIGTGAGFPGLALKIAYPNLQVTLLDSLNKRIKFLNEVIDRLELNDITAIHGRAEDFAKEKNYFSLLKDKLSQWSL